MKILLIVAFILIVYSHGIEGDDFSNQVRLTYGSLIKLTNPASSYIIHSHDIMFGRGGVMSVTGYGIDDLGSYWQVNEGFKSYTKTFEDIVRCNDQVSISSAIMDYFLRVEETQFGLTTQLLPMVHGMKRQGLDDKINWRISCVDKQEGQQIHYGDKIRFKHQITGKYASLDPVYAYTEANCGRGCSIANQLELHALDASDDTTTVFQIRTGIAFDQQYVKMQIKTE